MYVYWLKDDINEVRLVEILAHSFHIPSLSVGELLQKKDCLVRYQKKKFGNGCDFNYEICVYPLDKLAKKYDITELRLGLFISNSLKCAVLIDADNPFEDPYVYRLIENGKVALVDEIPKEQYGIMIKRKSRRGSGRKSRRGPSIVTFFYKRKAVGGQKP